jgi:carbamoylphosphate synthase large subunit
MKVVDEVRRKMIALHGVSALLVLLVACNQAHDRDRGEQAVAQFHSRLDAEQYQAIYTDSDDQLRKISNGEFPAFLRSVHTKLGRVKQATLTSSSVGWVAGEGTVITLFYNTQFVDGRVNEKFIWHMHNDSLILHGYYIKPSN